LQNNSRLGVEVNSEVYSCSILQTFQESGCLTLAGYVDKYINNYSVESNLR